MSEQNPTPAQETPETTAPAPTEATRALEAGAEIHADPADLQPGAELSATLRSDGGVDLAPAKEGEGDVVYGGEAPAEEGSILEVGVDFISALFSTALNAPANLISDVVKKTERRFEGANADGHAKKEWAVDQVVKRLVGLSPSLLHRFRDEIRAVVDGPIETAVDELNYWLKREPK